MLTDLSNTVIVAVVLAMIIPNHTMILTNHPPCVVVTTAILTASIFTIKIILVVFGIVVMFAGPVSESYLLGVGPEIAES